VLSNFGSHDLLRPHSQGVVSFRTSTAIQHAPGSRVLVGVRRTSGMVDIHVLDQGPGVPDALKDEIFSEFVRGNPNGPGRIDGLGLGLSIVKRTAKLLDLQIGFRSTERRGTRVSVEGLSVVNQYRPVRHDVNDTKQLKFENLRVLVVDDNEQVLFGLGQLLRGWGYQVTTCLPDDVISVVPDILLMDYHLNQSTNGLELANQICTKFDRQIPTAIISGTTTPQIRKLAKIEGFWVMQKPVAPVQLRSVLLAMTE